MEESITQKFLIHIENYIKNFENKKLLEKNKNRNLGIIYTPSQIVDYIVSNVLSLFLANFINSEENFKDLSNLESLCLLISKNQQAKEKLNKIIKNIRILDPSCGSGRFLLSTAEKLYQINKLLEPEISDFELKTKIIQKNLFGIEIETSAIIVSKLRLFRWLISTNRDYLTYPNVNSKSLKYIDFNKIIEDFNLKFNIFNLDFLLEFRSDKFDIIIGNPPYVENKKIKDLSYKKKLSKKFKSAYRLFDLSIIFIERSLELLENYGYLSFILPNKFLSADYGIKIRELLLNQSEIEEIRNISSLKIFQNIAIYPIILSLKKNKQSKDHDVNIKIFNDLDNLIENNRNSTIIFNQNLVDKFPSKVFPISGNIELITYLFTHFKTFAESFNDLKIMYRPYGFLKYSKYFDNVSDECQSDKDLLLLGTGNIDKYHIKFDKRIKIAGKDIKISYFKYHSNFEDIWSDLDGEKLIFREIAKYFACSYDPGVFTNITGLYFIKIASLKTDQLFSLLTILNSSLIDSVFKTLFGTLHMAGGYLRFNGSFVKRLPLPNKFPFILSQLGKILQLIFQLKYDLDSYKPEILKYPELEIFYNKYYNHISTNLIFFNRLSNSLVKLLFLDEFYLESNLDYNFLRELFSLNIELQKVPYKFLIPRFDIKNYRVFSLNELNTILDEINQLYKRLHFNERLLFQIDHIIKNRVR